MSASRFEPIYKAHAIVEMVLFFEFLPNFSASIERLLPLRSELTDDFPSSNLIEVVEYTISAQGLEPPQPTTTPLKIGGIELRRFKPDGSLEWLIRVTPKSISIHCLEYTRWRFVWEKVNGYVGKIAEKLAGTEVSIASIGLKYVDQFVFHGELNDYDASLLLRRESSLLHSRAFTSKAQWHCHTGWFEEAPGLGQILSQMNIDSAISNVDGVSRNIVMIDHTFTRRTQIEGDLMLYILPEKIGEEARSKLAEWMHDASKKLFNDLLTDSVRNRINLYADETL
ncbi:TIGR04255 family protein [Ancylothrix sp. C2]|uniref:TIGR04255 family protein n=1 Tax=Ancylothrix sp. D3o TaxID=2953691 RepID=UPI0021BB9B8F|nr:TIGR04255 family protein [Ancylothrix sp. D3o]MCT7953249.1 TIGR04255 family protein [Ancylothrix sp. D3o]